MLLSNRIIHVTVKIQYNQKNTLYNKVQMKKYKEIHYVHSRRILEFS